MTAFFIPGISDEQRLVERAYGDMRKQIELDMGRRPSGRRILRLWTRRGSLDCITEVGMPDPLRGGIVMAIFDMGPHRPFVVWRQSDAGLQDCAREILGCSAYSVSEFDL
jgi:hypothetical protein